jgi:ketosteroid isomerase-like protein
MSQENVERVRAGYARAARGDFRFRDEDFADDFEFVTSPELPDAGTYRGEEAIRWNEAWFASFDELTIEATEITDADDKVLVGILQRGRPRGSDSQVEGRWRQVLTFRDGKIARAQLFSDRTQALEATGLSE